MLQVLSLNWHLVLCSQLHQQQSSLCVVAYIHDTKERQVYTGSYTSLFIVNIQWNLWFSEYYSYSHMTALFGLPHVKLFTHSTIKSCFNKEGVRPRTDTSLSHYRESLICWDVWHAVEIKAPYCCPNSLLGIIPLFDIATSHLAKLNHKKNLCMYGVKNVWMYAYCYSMVFTYKYQYSVWNVVLMKTPFTLRCK